MSDLIGDQEHWCPNRAGEARRLSEEQEASTESANPETEGALDGDSPTNANGKRHGQTSSETGPKKRGRKSSHGCDWKGAHRDFPGHWAECGFVEQSCRNCGCDVKFPRKNAEKHAEKCKFAMMKCSRDGCNQPYLRKDEKMHLEQCKGAGETAAGASGVSSHSSERQQTRKQNAFMEAASDSRRWNLCRRRLRVLRRL